MTDPVTYLVAYDGSPLADAALERAAAHADALGEDVVVASVLPADEALAGEYGWSDDGEYDPDTVAADLRAAALATAPDATVRIERIGPYAGRTRIARTIHDLADEHEADVVFVGSDDAGRVVEPVSSVGGAVATGTDYDVYVVRSS